MQGLPDGEGAGSDAFLEGGPLHATELTIQRLVRAVLLSSEHADLQKAPDVPQLR